MIICTDYEKRAKEAALYIIKNKATVRQAARFMGIGKSTLHKDICEKLPLYAPELCPLVREILNINKSERHIRGGQATKEKYLRKKGAPKA